MSGGSGLLAMNGTTKGRLSNRAVLGLNQQHSLRSGHKYVCELASLVCSHWIPVDLVTTKRPMQPHLNVTFI